MKTTKTLILGLMLSLSGLSFAQTKAINNANAANKETETMVMNLALTPEQKSKIESINNGVAQKNMAIESNTLMNDAQKKEAYAGNENARLSMIKSILTEEQYTKYITPAPVKKEPRKIQNKELKTLEPAKQN